MEELGFKGSILYTDVIHKFFLIQNPPSCFIRITGRGRTVGIELD